MNPIPNIFLFRFVPMAPFISIPAFCRIDSIEKEWNRGMKWVNLVLNQLNHYIKSDSIQIFFKHRPSKHLLVPSQQQNTRKI